MKTTLTVAYHEFLEDLKNVNPKIEIPEYTHESIVEWIKSCDNIDTKSLKMGNIDVGKIYTKATITTKKHLLNHLKCIKTLAGQTMEEVVEPDENNNDTTDILSAMPDMSAMTSAMSSMNVASFITPENLDDITQLVSAHKGEGGNIVDVVRNIVNDKKFENLVNKITKGMEHN